MKSIYILIFKKRWYLFGFLIFIGFCMNLFLWNESSELSNDIGSCNDECFQGFYLFLIEEKGYDWLLIKDENTEAYIDVKIPSNYIYVVFENFLKWIEQSTILVLRSFLEEKRGMH